jgi:hypothetical protein
MSDELKATHSLLITHYSSLFWRKELVSNQIDENGREEETFVPDCG